MAVVVVVVVAEVEVERVGGSWELGGMRREGQLGAGRTRANCYLVFSPIVPFIVESINRRESAG
jgi:hypothetical protein